jgi:hypothetical protein
MESTQNPTILTPQQQAWIDFCATAGMSIDEEGNPKKIAAEELAKMLGVSRSTLYDWRDRIPGFWQLVATRRDEIYSQSRMSLVYKAVFHKAVKGDIAAANLLMKQSGILKADKSEQTIKVESVDDALDD